MNRMFGPGGSLDSQTTETQWYKGLTGCDGRFGEYHEDGTPMIRMSFFSIIFPIRDLTPC